MDKKLLSEYIGTITEILKREDIGYDISGYYINIENTSTMTRIKLVDCLPPFENKYLGVVVQEFDENGNQTYSREFANWTGKAFINRVKRNVG